MINVFIARAGSSFTATVEDSDFELIVRALKTGSDDVLRLSGTDDEVILARVEDIVAVMQLDDEVVERKREAARRRQELDPRQGIIGMKHGPE